MFSFGGTIGIKYGLQFGTMAHFYSAAPSTLLLDTGGQEAGEIFQTDLNGDGTYGDLLPGTKPGAYMHQVKGAGLNNAIRDFNSQDAGQLTPAGQALVSAGLFTQTQLSSNWARSFRPWPTAGRPSAQQPGLPHLRRERQLPDQAEVAGRGRFASRRRCRSTTSSTWPTSAT